MPFIVEFFNKMVVNVLENIFKPFTILNSAIRRGRISEVKDGKKQIIAGLLISLPLLVIIMMLLNSADMVFSYYIRNITDIFKNIKLEKFVPHVVLSLVIAFYLFAYVWSFKRESRAEASNIDLSGLSLEAVTVITVLVVLNILYLIFTIIQFSYLYGGGSMTLPASFTYAEYARRGFFELSAVTFINFVIVLCCINFTKRDNKKLAAAGNLLLSVLILFTLNMLYSAHFKLTMYENTFGYTYLRVLVHLFMLLLFILSIIVLAGIWCRKIPVVKSIIITSIIMYTIVNYLNINGFIARKNIERYHTTGKLDAYYLTSLSFEAVPYMLELKDVNDENIKKAIGDNLKYRKEVLERQNSWSEFNFSKNKVRKLLNN